MCWHPLRFYRCRTSSVLGVVALNGVSRSSFFSVSRAKHALPHPSTPIRSSPTHVVDHPETNDILPTPISISCPSLDVCPTMNCHSGSACEHSPLPGPHGSHSRALSFPSFPNTAPSTFSGPCGTATTAAGLGGKSSPLPPPLWRVWWSSCPMDSLSEEKKKQFQSLQSLLDDAAALSTRVSGVDAASCRVSSSSLQEDRGGVWQEKKSQTRLPATGEVLVTCRLCTAEPKGFHSPRRGERTPNEVQPSVSPSAAIPLLSSSKAFNAVNYALHRRLHPPPTCTLKGILKGCAEQNALGAAAAAGYNYVYHVQAMYLLAECWMEAEEDGDAVSHTAGEPFVKDCHATEGRGIKKRTTRLRRHHHFPFPCAECWRYLKEIGRLKHQLGLPPLELWIQVPYEGEERHTMEREEGMGECSCATPGDSRMSGEPKNLLEGEEKDGFCSRPKKENPKDTMQQTIPRFSAPFASDETSSTRRLSAVPIPEVEGIALCFVHMHKNWQSSPSLSSFLLSLSSLSHLPKRKEKKKEERRE